MLFPIFGTPTPLTQYILRFAGIIADELYGSHHYVTMVTIDDLRKAWSQRDGKAVILHSDIPQGAIVKLFKGLKAPILIVVENPFDVVAFLQRSRSYDLRGSIRYASQSLAILSDLNAFCEATVVDCGFYSKTPDEFINLFVNVFGLDLPLATRKAILKRIGISIDREKEINILEFVLNEVPSSVTPLQYEQFYSSKDVKFIRSSIDQYAGLFANCATSTLTWPTEIFPDRDNLDSILSGAKSLVGPARIMFGGHTLHLPIGEWRVAVEISVSGNLSGNTLFSQVYLGERLLRHVTMPLPRHGSFEFEIDFAIDDAFHPTQLLIGIAEGAIEGEIELRQARFTRLRSDSFARAN